VDTKFKNILSKGRFDRYRFSSANIYQILTYAGSQLHSSRPPSEAVLLYPAVDLNISEFVQFPSIKLRFETIDLDRPWPEIEEALEKVFA
jgi:5-methylcytosine-specific restriction enzyme subunit McrC